MNVLRTPDERFETLPGYPFAPHYHQIAEVLRIHYLDEGRRGALTSANYMEEARCAVEDARILDQVMTLVFRTRGEGPCRPRASAERRVRGDISKRFAPAGSARSRAVQGDLLERQPEFHCHPDATCAVPMGSF